MIPTTIATRRKHEHFFIKNSIRCLASNGNLVITLIATRRVSSRFFPMSGSFRLEESLLKPVRSAVFINRERNKETERIERERERGSGRERELHL